MECTFDIERYKVTAANTLKRSKNKNKDKQRRESFNRHQQQLRTELKAKYPNYNFKSNLLGALFFVGSALTIWEIYIYEVTFISVYIPLNIWLLTGVIITPLFKKTFNIYCFNPYTPGNTHLLFHYFFNIVSFGGIVVFLFMLTNQAFRGQSESQLYVPIISYGQLATSSNSCGNPYVHIIYKEEEKELIFPCGTPVEKSRRVRINVSKGLWGFDVIKDQTLE